jgi:hypothetical protein
VGLFLHTRWIWTVFIVGAVAFASGRVPYDDEWYSLTLLTEASDSSFWRSLGRDMHPPWLAMWDRMLWSLTEARWPLHLSRVLACVAASALWLSVLTKVVGKRSGWLALALLHPVVFYYGGAQRWYPILFLAHALRHWAILSPAREDRRALAFVSGAVLGFCASYVDLLFLVHDGAHYLWRSRARRRFALLTLAGALCLVLSLLIASPIAAEHWAMFGRQVDKPWSLIHAVLWAGLGPMGEALPHVILLLFVPVVVLASLCGARTLQRAGAPSQLPWLAGTLVVTWLIATCFGVWSPRYSLELWWMMTLALIAPLALGYGPRRLSGVALAAVVLGLVCTLWGGFFFKADLNGPPDALCAELSGGADVDAYVIPYHRITEQLRAHCHPKADLVQLPAMKHVESPEDFGRALNARVAQGGRLTLLALNSPATIRFSRAAVREILDARCTLVGERPLWEPPHPWLRAYAFERPSHRLNAMDYECP